MKTEAYVITAIVIIKVKVESGMKHHHHSFNSNTAVAHVALVFATLGHITAGFILPPLYNF